MMGFRYFRIWEGKKKKKEEEKDRETNWVCGFLNIFSTVHVLVVVQRR